MESILTASTSILSLAESSFHPPPPLTENVFGQGELQLLPRYYVQPSISFEMAYVKPQ